jgi:hypothetical protein
VLGVEEQAARTADKVADRGESGEEEKEEIPNQDLK